LATYSPRPGLRQVARLPGPLPPAPDRAHPLSARSRHFRRGSYVDGDPLRESALHRLLTLQSADLSEPPVSLSGEDDRLFHALRDNGSACPRLVSLEARSSTHVSHSELDESCPRVCGDPQPRGTTRFNNHSE